LSRALYIATALAALVPFFFALIADIEPDAVMKAQTGVSLFLAIVAIVLVTSLITGLYLLIFGKVAGRLSRHYFPFFIGWKFLRSQRTAPTLRTRLANLRTRVAARGNANKYGLIGGGLALFVGGLVLQNEAVWNGIAGDVSPSFATSLQLSLQGLGGLLFLVGLGMLLTRAAVNAQRARYRLRSAVTLPTFISIVGVAIGLWALIVVLGVMHGLQSDLREKILRTNAHLIIEPAAAEGGFDDALALEDHIRRLPGIVEAHAIARGDVMMSFPGGGAAYGITVKGMSDAALVSTVQLQDQIVEGKTEFLLRPEILVWDRARFPLPRHNSDRKRLKLTFEDEDTKAPRDDEEPAFSVMDSAPEVYPGIVLGAELARTLGVGVGDDIQLIAPDGDIGPTGLRPKTSPFRVAAVFRTGMYEYDQKLAYTTMDSAQRFFNLGSQRNAFEAHVATPEDATTIALQLRSELGTNVIVETFQERNANLFAALMLERLIMLIILAFIIFVASLLIVISLVMFVIEKMREVAVLKTLGARNGQVVGGFITIGGIIAGFGILIGIPLGVGTCYLLIASGLSLPQQFYIRTLPVRLDPVDITIFGLAALGICLVATIYPAIRAAHLQPADGIRNG